MLFGYPGCGKTHLARAIESEFHINFIYVKGPEILDKYIGGSEANVRRLFEEAEAKGPSVLFFDEFDSIVPTRSSSTAAVTDRIVNQFLTYLDGVVPLKKTFVVAATSRPDLIDPAVIRPGRIDTHVFCGLPSTLERSDAVKCTFNDKLGMQLTQSEIDELTAKTDGFSYADISLVAHKLQMASRAKGLQNVAKSDIIASLSEVKPVSTSKDFKKLERLFANFMSGNANPEVMHQRHTLA